MTFTSLHHAQIPFMVRPDISPFTTLHYTSPHFTSLHYTFYIIFNTHFLQFTTLITSLALFLKAFGLQGRVPKFSVGNWFQSQMVLFTKEFSLTYKCSHYTLHTATASVCICFLIVYTVPCTLDHMLYNVYEFNVKSGTAYYILQLYVKSLLLLV